MINPDILDTNIKIIKNKYKNIIFIKKFLYLNFIDK